MDDILCESFIICIVNTSLLDSRKGQRKRLCESSAEDTLARNASTNRKELTKAMPRKLFETPTSGSTGLKDAPRDAI
ncbi:unnamed protein product, partial [Tenebrio molitor]